VSARTVAIGDIHGDLVHLLALWDALPALDGDDTLVFLGDYVDRGWAHPSVVEPQATLLWTRAKTFFQGYEGKQIVVGHTPTGLLPPELSEHTPGDTEDAWVRGQVFATDTGCGKGGFLTAVMFPGRVVYESRRAP
jgi:hypothetical protein